MTDRRSRGILIAIEGIDGAGKSTLQRNLAARYRRRGWRVAIAREPADPTLGRAAQRATPKDPVAGALLFTLDRALARPGIAAALARGAIVLQDRSYYSTLAYQGSALPAAQERSLVTLQRQVTLEPDRILWVDLPPARALARVWDRGRERSPLERIPTLRKVRRAYRGLLRPPRWIRLDGEASPPEIAEAAERALERFVAPRMRRARRTARGRSSA